jgi:hypothetical protein
VDDRYEQLLALAAEGDENAKSDLWREYGMDWP